MRVATYALGKHIRSVRPVGQPLTTMKRSASATQADPFTSSPRHSPAWISLRSTHPEGLGLFLKMDGAKQYPPRSSARARRLRVSLSRWRTRRSATQIGGGPLSRRLSVHPAVGYALGASCARRLRFNPVASGPHRLDNEPMNAVKLFRRADHFGMDSSFIRRCV